MFFSFMESDSCICQGTAVCKKLILNQMLFSFTFVSMQQQNQLISFIKFLNSKTSEPEAYGPSQE
jgi:hypothetical protein